MPFVFRNAKSTQLSIHKVDEKQIMQDVINYLKSDPEQVDRDRADFDRVARSLIEGYGEKYVGDEVRSWEKTLEPKANHQDKYRWEHFLDRGLGARLGDPTTRRGR